MLPQPRDRPETYNRDALYAKVWAEPVANVAERYGVSGVALAKACRKLGVPVPARGYRAKCTAGQTSERPRLPPQAADPRAGVIAVIPIRPAPCRECSQRARGS